MPTIEEVKARYTDRLLELPAVVSVGLGQDPDSGRVIIVGLEEERPGAQNALPIELEGYPVRARVIGTRRTRSP